MLVYLCLCPIFKTLRFVSVSCLWGVIMWSVCVVVAVVQCTEYLLDSIGWIAWFLLGPCRISGYYPVSGTIWQFYSYLISSRIAFASGRISGSIFFFNSYIIIMKKKTIFVREKWLKKIFKHYFTYNFLKLFFFQYWYSPLWRYAGTLPQKWPKKLKHYEWSKKCFMKNKVRQPDIR